MATSQPGIAPGEASETHQAVPQKDLMDPNTGPAKSTSFFCFLKYIEHNYSLNKINVSHLVTKLKLSRVAEAKNQITHNY